MKKIILVLLIGIIFLAGCIEQGAIKKPVMPSVTLPKISKESSLKKFSSYDEMKEYIDASEEGVLNDYSTIGTAFETGAMPMLAGSEKSVAGGSGDFSTTNIQVEGVDEADIVKNDGKYIYIVSGKNIVIVDAYPANNAEILSRINVDGTPSEIFVNKDKLVVFGSVNYRRTYETPEIASAAGVPASEMIVPPYYNSETFIYVYDISNREKPKLIKDLYVDGYYYDSRMIGDYVYAIVNAQRYYGRDMVLPQVKTEANAVGCAADKAGCVFSDVYYFDNPDYSYGFTTILSLNIEDNEDVESKLFLMGSTNNMYVSLDNIYITRTKYYGPIILMEKIVDDVYAPILPLDVKERIKDIENSDISKNKKWLEINNIINDYRNKLSSTERRELSKEINMRMEPIQREIVKESEKTIIYKINIDNGDIEYKAKGLVPGNVLNQFSMDEFNNYFRIATTTGHVSRSNEPSSSNHIYVLDEDLDIVGKLEDLAPGERIYSARFMGKRAYLVTFKKIDPLFVIDLSDPRNPNVLGKLKIPGYSDYLHPYDEDHIIGIGKEAAEAEEGNFAWYQGIKIALFDVGDVEHPKEISKYNIGDRGTDSEALHEHKAFLFSKDKNLLVIPITLAEIDEAKYPMGVEANTFGEYVWQGAYVLDVSLRDGFVLRGRVSHVEDEDVFKKSGYYYRSYGASIRRSLYIDDVLYTISNNMIKMNDLDDLDELNKVRLPYQEDYPVVYAE